MTVASAVNKVTYTGNGATTDFATGFLFYAAEDLTVIETVISTGVETVLSLNTHYTVTGVGDPNGGTVVAVTAPASTKKWTILREVDYVQEYNPEDGDPLASLSLEQAFDLVCMMAQQLKELSDRSIRFPRSDSTSLTAQLPVASLRANKAVVFDADGNAAVSTDDYEDQAAAAAAYAAAADTARLAAVAAKTAAETAETNAETAETNAETAQAAAEAAAALVPPGVNVKAAPYSAVGDGTTDDRAALAAADAVGAIFLPPGTYLVSTNLTIANAVTFSPGAKIKPANGVTVTFSGYVDAPNTQVFTNATSGTGTVAGLANPELRAEWWGIVTDGATDNAAAAQAAHLCAAGRVVNYPKGAIRLTGPVDALVQAYNIATPPSPLMPVAVRGAGPAVYSTGIVSNGASSNYSNDDLGTRLGGQATVFKCDNCALVGAVDTASVNGTIGAVTVEDAVIYGVNSAPIGIYVNGSPNTSVKRCTVAFFGYFGFLTRGGTFIDISDVQSHDNGWNYAATGSAGTGADYRSGCGLMFLSNTTAADYSTVGAAKPTTVRVANYYASVRAHTCTTKSGLRSAQFHGVQDGLLDNVGGYTGFYFNLTGYIRWQGHVENYSVDGLDATDATPMCAYINGSKVIWTGGLMTPNQGSTAPVAVQTANGVWGSTLTRLDNVTAGGSYALTLTQTADTTLTLPTTGTLATLAGTETFSGKSAGQNWNPDGDNTRDLGTAALRWNDLFLGGGAYIGGTTSANFLDDYEEGTWTPAVSFGGGTTGITYARQTGKYIKVGDQVTVWFDVALSNKGSSTGQMLLTGLPFTVQNAPAFQSGAATASYNNFQGTAGLGLAPEYAAATAIIRQLTAGSTTDVTDANVNNSSSFQGCFTYSI